MAAAYSILGTPGLKCFQIKGQLYTNLHKMISKEGELKSFWETVHQEN